MVEEGSETSLAQIFLPSQRISLQPRLSLPALAAKMEKVLPDIMSSLCANVS